MAVVVPVDPGAPPTAEELLSFCRQHMAGYKRPTAVAVVEQLPRTALGKVRKSELRAHYGKINSME